MMDSFYIGHLIFLGIQVQVSLADYWSEWWSYKGITGPSNWHHNSAWKRCNDGKHQSPVNIDPQILLFDPKLKSLKVDTLRIPSKLVNTQQDITLFGLKTANISISAGPLSYNYQAEHVKFHFGRDNGHGSEHTIGNKSFPAELQIYSYNTDLYDNFTQAMMRSQGIAAISVFIQIGDKTSKELSILAKEFTTVRYKGGTVNFTGISISNLLPKTNGYLTYEGSLPHPGCYETVTWIIMNKPIYISKHHMTHLRNIRSTEKDSSYQTPMSDNRRPVLPLYHRAVRTNVNFVKKTPLCDMERVKKYKVNKLFQGR